MKDSKLIQQTTNSKTVVNVDVCRAEEASLVIVLALLSNAAPSASASQLLGRTQVTTLEAGTVPLHFDPLLVIPAVTTTSCVKVFITTTVLVPSGLSVATL